jgi:hypothetical protein
MIIVNAEDPEGSRLPNVKHIFIILIEPEFIHLIAVRHLPNSWPSYETTWPSYETSDPLWFLPNCLAYTDIDAPRAVGVGQPVRRDRGSGDGGGWGAGSSADVYS